MFSRLGCALILVFGPLSALAQTDPELATNRQQASYIIGLQYGQNIQSRSPELDAAAFSLGVQHAMQDTPPIVPMEQMQAIMAAFQAAIAAEESGAAESNLQASMKYLDENKARDEVITLPSGLDAKISSLDRPSSTRPRFH